MNDRMSFNDLFLLVEPKVQEWQDLADEFGDCDGVIRLPAIIEPLATPIPGVAGIVPTDHGPVPYREIRKPDRLFVGRLGMTLIAENYRPNQSIVNYDGTAFRVLWLLVVYVPWLTPESVIVGTEADRPAMPASPDPRLVSVAEARRRYEHG